MTELLNITGQMEHPNTGSLSIDSEISITSFNGGIDKGSMVQISIGDRYSQLTNEQVRLLIKSLIDWL